MSILPDQVEEQVSKAKRLNLFLDYDGTLADLAPTPDHVVPDPQVARLLTALVRHPRLWVAVVSGRRLSHVERLVPVQDALLAGTYGIELRMPGGERIDRVDFDTVRPLLESIKPRWTALIAEREGFFLEDKEWALALHARFAEDEEANSVLKTARSIAEQVPSDLFRILGGHKFLEVGPKLAHKGRTVEFLLAQHANAKGLPLYLGDDDKDEEAFRVIKANGGISLLVSAEPRDTTADGRLESPQATRRWLWTLLAEPPQP